jgi:hypothetical protein
MVISEKSELQYHQDIYTDVGYLNDPHNVYLHGGSVTPLSLKQTLVTSPTNHAGIQSHVTRVALRNDKPHT